MSKTELKEVEVGRGVFLMDGWSNKLPNPQDALTVVRNSHHIYGGDLKDAALGLFIKICVMHNAWCKLTWYAIEAEARRRYRNRNDVALIVKAMEEAINDGLLSFQKRRWFEWLDPRIICPTQQLLDRISKNKQSVVT
jgi:hypothetical protein